MEACCDAGIVYTPVRLLPGLQSITFYEATLSSVPDAFTFTVDGPELTQRLSDPLTANHYDILGAESEYYDVYYSNADGSFNVDGSYLTISGIFLHALPVGGGLNLAEIALTFSGLPPEYGSEVGSFAALGDNAIPSQVGACIDGDLSTSTTMGNTVGTSERLRITLGFPSSVHIN